MAKQDKDDDFSAFDEVAAIPDEDFAAFDQVAAPIPGGSASILDRILSGLTPSQETMDTIGNIAQTGQDFATGVAGGLSMNSLDELGGAMGAGVEKGLGALGIGPAAVDQQLADQGFQGVQQPMQDTYRDYQQGISNTVDQAEERSPIASTAGQIAGGVTGGVALGGALGLGGAAAGGAESISSIAANSGKAKAALELLRRGGTAYAKAAPALAAESALTSDEQLIGPNANPMGVAGDVAGGLAFGLPAMLGMQGITDVAAPALSKAAGKVSSKAAEIADGSPLVRQVKLAYNKYGKEFQVNPTSEKAIKEGVEKVEQGTPFALLDKKRATEITQDVLKKDEQLGSIVGSSLDDATKEGVKIDASDLVNQTYQSIVQLAEEMPSLTKDANFNNMITKVLSRDYKNASPRDIKNAMDDITNTIDRIGSYKLPSPELEEAPKFLRTLRKGLDQRLKDQVPAYRDSAERFSQYRSTYMEQPIAGGDDPVLDDLYYGSMRKGEKKLTSAYEDLVKRSSSESQSNEATEERYAKLLQRAKEFQKTEEGRVASGKIKTPVTEDPNSFMRKIRDYSDDAAVRRSSRQTQESQDGGVRALKSVAGIAQTGKGALLSGAYLAGRASSAPLTRSVADIGRAIYRAPAQTLSNLASRLESSQQFSSVGKALREGLENGDSAKKNAALFTIMQNPNSRALISAEDFSDDEENME